MIFRFDGQEFSDTRNNESQAFAFFFPFCSRSVTHFFTFYCSRSDGTPLYNGAMNRKSTEFEVETIGTPKLSNIPNARNKAEANPDVKYGIKTEPAGWNARASRQAVQRRRPLRLPRFFRVSIGLSGYGTCAVCGARQRAALVYILAHVP